MGNRVAVTKDSLSPLGVGVVPCEVDPGTIVIRSDGAFEVDLVEHSDGVVRISLRVNDQKIVVITNLQEG